MHTRRQPENVKQKKQRQRHWEEII
jgi:hypothetical protein